MTAKIKILNIEEGMPTVDEARKRLTEGLNQAKSNGCEGMKIIHGYGSSGVGGKLRVAIRKSLANRQKEGIIRSYVPGENWSIFEQGTIQVLDHCPELSKDTHLGKGNGGITIVLI